MRPQPKVWSPQGLRRHRVADTGGAVEQEVAAEQWSLDLADAARLIVASCSPGRLRSRLDSPWRTQPVIVTDPLGGRHRGHDTRICGIRQPTTVDEDGLAVGQPQRGEGPRTRRHRRGCGLARGVPAPRTCRSRRPASTQGPWEEVGDRGPGPAAGRCVVVGRHPISVVALRLIPVVLPESELVGERRKERGKDESPEPPRGAEGA